MEFSCEQFGELRGDDFGSFFGTPSVEVECEGSEEASYRETPSYRLRVRPFESLYATEKSVRLLNAYYSIWFGEHRVP